MDNIFFDLMISVDDLKDFVKSSSTPVSFKDIAKAFHLKGAQRRALRTWLDDLAFEGVIHYDKQFHIKLEPDMPEKLDVQIVGIDEEGLYKAEALAPDWRHLDIVIDAEELSLGSQAKVTLTPDYDGRYKARIIRIFKENTPEVVATYRVMGERAFIETLNNNLKPNQYLPTEEQMKSLKDKQVILIRPKGVNNLGYGLCDVKKVLGDSIDGLETLVTLMDFGLKEQFPQEVENHTNAIIKELSAKDLEEREDLRKLPLVTIDGADARDFDDAVWAETTDKGYHIIVAIADVAHYVEENSVLDIEAQKRGNSTYFPDRVVPMLPERLCNDLCSLNPKEDRPSLAVHLYIDNKGKLINFKFSRAVIHSHARLTYDEVQQALDGDTTNKNVGQVFESTIQPLFMAYKVLLEARKNRNTLDLDVPEKFIRMEEDKILGVEERARFDAHMLIEEMMILANVAAARALSKVKAPCLYRVHPIPSVEKLDTLRNTLKPFKIYLSEKVTPETVNLNNIAQSIRAKQLDAILMTSLLRAQSQARYDLENEGHYGLALTHYAHFTSPIRRYSDLIVHRSLVKHLKLAGKGGLKTPESELDDIADIINKTERNSQLAEWSAKDKLIARYYRGHRGDCYKAQITSVQKFGLFVSIEGNTAEGLIPLRYMGDEPFYFDEKTLTLIGRRSKQKFRIGDDIEVTVVESDNLIGKLTFARGQQKVIIDDNGLGKLENEPDFSKTKRGPKRFDRNKKTSSKKVKGDKNTQKKRPSRHKKRR